jgi:hypothetical protein
MTTSRQEQIDEAQAEIAKILERQEKYIKERQMSDDWNGEDIYCDESQLDAWGLIITRLLAEEDFEQESMQGE